MHKVFLSLGSNKGNRLFYIKKAVKEIKNRIGSITHESDIFETESWSYTDKKYLNAVIIVETELPVYDVFLITQNIEKKLGRETKTVYNDKNEAQYSSRTIDVDILFCDTEIIETKDLIIPHPKLHLRNFVLEPMMQIAPDFIHPVLKQKIKEIYEKCEDKSKVDLFYDNLK